MIVHVVGVAVHLVHPPDVFIGRIDADNKHTMTGQVTVPLARLAVLDEEELIFNGSIQPVAQVALVEWLHLIGSTLFNQYGFSKS